MKYSSCLIGPLLILSLRLWQDVCLILPIDAATSVVYLKLTRGNSIRRSQWPRGLRRTSADARPLRSWIRIPPVAWMSVCCERCVLSSRDLCNELITRPEESYRLWWVVCDLETSWMGRPWPTGAGGGCCFKNKQTKKLNSIHKYPTLVMLFAPCILILLYNIKQQNAHFLN
jgi:hypothetical protein